MRVAHIIMAHKNPAQLERLIRRLHHPDFDFYIHLDKKVDIKDFVYLRNIPQVNFIHNRTICNWGGNSLFKAIIDSVTEVLRPGVAYDFINLLSGQDYPLRSAEAIHSFLRERPEASFITFEKSRDSAWWLAAEKRYQCYHLTDMKFTGRYFLQRIINRVLPLRKFPGSYTLYGGNRSSWWMLNRQCAAYLVSTLQKNTRLKRFIKLSWCTDEFIIPTIIMNSIFRETVINENYRYIDWSEGNAHPKVLDRNDLDKMMTSDMLFARKFDIDVDASVLDKIDILINNTSKKVNEIL